MQFIGQMLGKIYFKDKESMDYYLEFLRENGFMEGNRFKNFIGNIVSSTDDVIENNGEYAVRIPLTYYNNFLSIINRIPTGSHYRIVWVSTDGCLWGGIAVPSDTIFVELDEWGRVVVGEPPKDKYEYQVWQNNVLNAFLYCNYYNADFTVDMSLVRYLNEDEDTVFIGDEYVLYIRNKQIIVEPRKDIEVSEDKKC